MHSRFTWILAGCLVVLGVRVAIPAEEGNREVVRSGGPQAARESKGNGMANGCGWYRTDNLARELSQLDETEIAKFAGSELLDVRPVVVPHADTVVGANDYLMWPISAQVDGTLVVLYSRVPCHWGEDRGKADRNSGIRMVVTSDDGGRTWSEPVDVLEAGRWNESPFRNGVCGGGLGVHDGTVYLAIREGVFRSVDKGRDWELVSAEPHFGEHPFPLWAPGMRVTFDEAHGMIVWTNSGFASARKSTEDYGSRLGAFYSPDFGTTWHYEEQAVPEGMGLSEVTPLLFDGKMAFFLRNGFRGTYYAQGYSHSGWFPFTFALTNVGPVGIMDTPDVIYNPVTGRLEAAVSHRDGQGPGPAKMKVNLYSLGPEELAAGKTEWRFEGTLICYRERFGKSDGFNPVGSVVDSSAGVQYLHVWGGDCKERAAIFQYSRSLDTPAVATYLKSFYTSDPK